MNKLKLNESGKYRIKNLKVMLEWLSLGGELETSDGHRLAMTSDGMVGLRVIEVLESRSIQEESIMMCDDPSVLSLLISEADAMPLVTRNMIKANIRLNKSI